MARTPVQSLFGPLPPVLVEQQADYSTMIKFDDIVLSAFPQLTTHLKHLENDPLSQIFPHDALIAVCAVTYCRYTVHYTGEPKISRIFWSAVLGYLAYNRYDYWMQCYAHILSFGIFFYDKACAYQASKVTKKSVDELNKQAQALTAVVTGFLVIGHVLFSISNPASANSFFQSNMYKFCSNNPIISKLFAKIYAKIMDSVGYLLPVNEFISAHDIITEFVEPSQLYPKAAHLLYVTFHIQVGMGYLGISFLTAEQSRKNALVKIEDDLKKSSQEEVNVPSNRTKANGSKSKDKKIEKKKNYDPSTKFRKSAGPFIFFVALPYMVQIVFYGGMNMYAFHCFRDDIHRTVRLNDLFANDGSRFVATATSKVSKLSPESYASNSETVVTTVYDMFNRNLFSLPKLMLIPGIVAKQPLMMLKITPLILLSDWIKSTIVAVITTEVERVKKEIKDLESMRTKVEQYDLKNSELIQRSGYDSVLFTERKWVSLTEDIQDKKARTSLMTRSKSYFSGLQRHFIMMALVDCALAKLIAVGKIFATDIFVYARAIEDMINFVLMRSRAESELATMESSIKVLRELKDIWDASEERRLLECTVNRTKDTLDIEGLSYTRGSASVTIEDISLSPGVYAVTGANGSGKSTLFRVLMGCKSNMESVDLHSSIEMNTPGSIQMPSSEVIEITQNFYFPLYSTPFDWIYNIDVFEGIPDESKRESMILKLENELKSLKFYPETQLEESESTLTKDLTTIKDDWFSDLSGGQKSKVELVRKVFLAEKCPRVLLIDETFAPLDPDSKNLVMQKLKQFCSDSILLVIYHADVKTAEGAEGAEKSEDLTCVESSAFFDNNVHVENGSLFLRPVCAE